MPSLLRVERVGQRAYVVGDSFAIKDQLKSAGCHWDGDRRQWWIGATKAAAVETIVAAAGTAPATDAAAKGVPDDTRLVAKAKYKGRTYYCPWVGQTKSGEYKARLVTLDGSLDFWATAARPNEQCDGNGDVAAIVKTYAPRERTFRGHTHTEYTTIGSIRSFVDREKRNRDEGGAVCAECGTSGELVRDLEDGMLKHRHCCDIEP
jgi:hypothetical protein